MNTCYGRLVACFGLVLPLAASAAPPSLPPVPSTLAAAVAKVAKQVDKVLTHCQTRGDRNPGEYHPWCAPTLRAIGGAGDAATYAIAQRLFGDGGAPLPECLDEDESFGARGEASETVYSLYAILGKQATTLSITVLLRDLSREPRIKACRTDVPSPLTDAGPTVRALGMATGIDLGEFEVAYDEAKDNARRSTLASAWLAWWSANANKPRSDWKAQGLIRARATLTSKDLGERTQAIARLLESKPDRKAALAALTAILSDPKQPAEHVFRLEAMVRQMKVPRSVIEKAKAKRLATATDGPWKEEREALLAAAPFRALMARCRSAFYALRLEESERACDKAFRASATKGDAGDPDALLGRAWAELELGKTKQAKKTALKAKDLMSPMGETDDPNVYTLLMAIELVAGDPKAVRTAFKGVRERPTAEMRTRLALLDGKPSTAMWTSYVAPRYFCWRARGEAEANAYLVRRGYPKPEAFLTALAALPKAKRTAVEKRGARMCPWPTTVSKSP